ncbi:hypothetical protein F2Q70_00038755 [Brassica cretica]|uniref:Uncharacterized protein n=1 Tax=Brassica cretica TaxID=69181 RepID=A0A8S9K4G2_BRACR|nr:hypothetical protein F2Q70_00038755 [Brassica cretica]KAF2619759.1 hypothetical protein F2Q68_00039423 [Brassica cretica]
MNYGAMVDDKTVLISEFGNDIILTIIFWKQWPWKPLRWAMFGFAVGMLTEYATGSDLVDQVKILLSNFGIIDLE